MKEAIYEVLWSRRKGKTFKQGNTHVVAADCPQAVVLFAHQYPDREIESVYKAGNDFIIPGRSVVS